MSDLPADSFPKASFAGIEFAYTSLSVKGGIRHAVHEFPHTPGGEVEKMGRKAYSIRFRAVFHDLPGSDYARAYPDAYPSSMRLLRKSFEEEVTGDLVIPTIGTIKACATDWTATFDPALMRTGEVFDIEFLEDSDRALLADIAIELGSPAAMVDLSDALIAAMKAAFLAEQSLSLLQKINDAITDVLAIAGRADAYARVVESKIRALDNLCQQAADGLDDLQHPENHLIANAVKDLALNARAMGEKIAATEATIKQITVKTTMSVSALSTLLYGTSERGFELLQLNPIEDALAIPAGTVIKYMP